MIEYPRVMKKDGYSKAKKRIGGNTRPTANSIWEYTA
jgi:hypothetical protein